MKHLLSEQVKKKLLQPPLDAINISLDNSKLRIETKLSPPAIDGHQQMERRCHFFL